jgi:hypothetical protein
LVERIIIDTYQYTMMCLLVPANAIAFMAINIAIRMLGFGHKVRELKDSNVEALRMSQARLIFCDSVDDHYLVDLAKTFPVRTYFIEWISGKASPFFKAIVEHCRLNSNDDDDNGWRKLLARPEQVGRSILEYHAPQPPAEQPPSAAEPSTGAAQPSVNTQREQHSVQQFADGDPDDDNDDNDDNNDNNDNNDHNDHDVKPTNSGPINCTTKNAATNTTIINYAIVNINRSASEDDDMDEEGEVHVAAPPLSPLPFDRGDVVVSSPQAVVAVGDPAMRTSPPESSPEEGEVPLTRSGLEALRRSSRAKRRRMSESK